jgi:hypothetical protein
MTNKSKKGFYFNISSEDAGIFVKPTQFGENQAVQVVMSIGAGNVKAADTLQDRVLSVLVDNFGITQDAVDALPDVEPITDELDYMPSEVRQNAWAEVTDEIKHVVDTDVVIPEVINADDIPELIGGLITAIIESPKKGNKMAYVSQDM